MNRTQKLLVWTVIIGTVLTVAFEGVIVHTRMAIYTVEYQTAQIDKETAAIRQEAEKARLQGYKALRGTK